MKCFILEEFLLINQNERLISERSISDSKNDSKLIESLLDQIE